MSPSSTDLIEQMIAGYPAKVQHLFDVSIVRVLPAIGPVVPFWSCRIVLMNPGIHPHQRPLPARRAAHAEGDTIDAAIAMAVEHFSAQ